MSWRKKLGIALGGVVIVLGLVFYYVYYEYYYLPQVRTLEWIKEALHSLMVRSGNWTIEYSGGGLLTGNDSIIEVWTIPASELPNSIFTYPFNPNAVYIVQFFILPNINETVGISQIEFPGGVTFEPLIVSGHPIFTNPSNPASWTGWNVVEVNPNCVGNWTFVFVPLKWTPLNFNNLTVWNEVYFNSPFNKSELLFNDTYWLEIFFNGSLLYSGVMTSTLQGITFNPPLNTPLVQYGVVSGTSQTACWTVLLAFPEDLNYINGYEVRIFTAFKENPFIFRVYTNNTLGFENLMNEVQSPKKIIVTLSFYNWTNPYTGWSWELYNVTSPFTQAMVEETLKAMSITPTPSQVMINGNNATLVFNNVPFGGVISITLPGGGSYEGTPNCWQSILRNVAGYYILTGIPNPITIQAYTNMNVNYIVVYNPMPGTCTFTP